jgi:hypothetical protein
MLKKFEFYMCPDGKCRLPDENGPGNDIYIKLFRTSYGNLITFTNGGADKMNKKIHVVLGYCKEIENKTKKEGICSIYVETVDRSKRIAISRLLDENGLVGPKNFW